MNTVTMSCKSFYFICHMKDFTNNFSFTNKLAYVALSSIVLTYVKEKVTDKIGHKNATCGSKGFCLTSCNFTTMNIQIKTSLTSATLLLASANLSAGGAIQTFAFSCSLSTALAGGTWVRLYFWLVHSPSLRLFHCPGLHKIKRLLV